MDKRGIRIPRKINDNRVKVTAIVFIIRTATIYRSTPDTSSKLFGGRECCRKTSVTARRCERCDKNDGGRIIQRGGEVYECPDKHQTIIIPLAPSHHSSKSIKIQSISHLTFTSCLASRLCQESSLLILLDMSKNERRKYLKLWTTPPTTRQVEPRIKSF